MAKETVTSVMFLEQLSEINICLILNYSLGEFWSVSFKIFQSEFMNYDYSVPRNNICAYLSNEA